MINKEKTKFFQWDVNQKFVNVKGVRLDFIINEEVYEVFAVDGVVGIPDEWLQTAGKKRVYECYENGTLVARDYIVEPRPQPTGYVYTPTEKATFESLVQMVEKTLDDSTEKVENVVALLQKMAEEGDFDGKDGEDGFSPVVEVVPLDDGYKVIITSKEGENVFVINDGKDGKDGADGKDGRDGVDGKDGRDGVDGKNGSDGKDGYTPIKGVDYFDGAKGDAGADGFSPSATVERVEGGAVITITDKDGTTSAPVYDGQGGGGGTVDPVARAGVEEVKADLTEQSESLDMLWKLSKGQTYDIQQKVESGMNVAPNGAKYETLLDVRGNSTQGENPSPDNPQSIISVEELNFSVGSPNLFDEQTVIDSSCVYSKNYISVKPNKKYFIPVTTGNTSNDGYQIIFYNADKVLISDNTYIRGTSKEQSFTTSNDCAYIRFRCFTSYGSVYKNDIIVSIANIPYTPYREPQTKQIIPPFALNKIGDYFDYADVDNGVWIRNIKSIDIASINLTLHSSEMFWKDFEFDDIRNIDVEEKSLLISDKYYGIAPINFARYVVGTMAQYSNDTGIRFCNGSKTEKPTGTLSYVSKTSTETPIDSADLEFLKSLFNMETENTNLIITDQDGNDISYLMEYIIKLSEVN